MQILDGKLVAETRRQKIKSEVEAFRKQSGRTPGLAVVLVGEDPASKVYVSHKVKACQEVGILSFETRLGSETTPEQLKREINRLNQDNQVDGILLQLPLPSGIHSDVAINWISPLKDADCLTTENLGRLWSGRRLTTPCTPWGVMVILQHYGIDPAGKEVVVVGRSNIVGKPLAHLFTQANATVTVCHSKTTNLKEHTRRADIVAVAAGRPEFLGAGDFKAGAVVIDVGIHRKPPNAEGKSKLCGDVRLNEIKDVISAGTPVPGGVGPMTITMLMENTLCLAKARPQPS